MMASSRSGDLINPSYSQIPNTKRLVFIFTIMFFSFYSINLFGRFLVVELLLFIGFLFHTLEGKLAPTTKRLKPLIKLLILTLLAELIVDVFIGTPSILMLKGFALILFTLTNLYGIALITNFKPMEIKIALLGYSFGGLAGFFIQPSTYARSEIWKFGIGSPVTSIVFLILSLPFFVKLRFLQWLILSLLSVLSLFFGARSLALLTIIPLFFLTLSNDTNNKKTSGIFRPIIITASVVFAFFNAYSYLAENGSLGVKAQSKYLTQTSASGNIIISSRSELIFAARAIADSPILGHGSYAALSPELRIKIMRFLEMKSIHYDMAPLNRIYGDRIPVHSMILQWWLWFGAFGLLFPLWLVFLYCKSLKVRNREPIFFYLALMGIWNVLFSPYGENYRILIPLTIVSLLSLKNSSPLNGGSHD